MTLFDQPLTLESLLARIEALEAQVMSKPVRQSTEVPPELRQAWSLWTLHKSGSKGWTAVAKTRQVRKLADLSGLDSDRAMRLVEEAIDKDWRTFYEVKDTPKLTLVPKVTGAKAAMASTETAFEKELGLIRHAHHFGQIDTAERDRRIAEATNRHRGS